MDTLVTFGKWLDGTALGQTVTAYPWIWPLAEALHFVGLALLFGTIGALDFRMLGLARQMALRPLHRLVPWGILGFAICAATGLLFFAGEPLQYIPNGVFWIKMGCIALAGANVAAFYLTGLARRVEALQPGEDAPRAAKLVAASSLVLWIAVMFWGRMLPFIGIAF